MKRAVAFSDPEVKLSNPKYNIKLKVADITWDDLCQYLCTCQQGGKHDGYFLRGGTMMHIGKYVSGSGKDWGEGYFRADRNLIDAWLVIIDGDQLKDGGNLPRAQDVIKQLPFTHMIYTTHSQSDKKNKWRLVIPTDRSYKKEELIPLVKYVCGLLDFEIDVVREMTVWSQAWYLPLRDDPKDGQFWAEECDTGEWLNVDKVLANETQRVVDDTSSSSVSNDNDMDSGKSLDELWAIIRVCGPGCHEAIINIEYQLARDGMSKANGVRMIQSMLACVPEQDRDARWRDRFSDAERCWGQTSAKNETVGSVTELIAEEVFVDHERELLEWPPGLTGELAKSVYNSSNYPNRMISIVTALGCIAAVAGRRFNIREDGLNIYLTLLMETGGGKSVIAKFISKFLNDSNVIVGDHTFVGPKRVTGPKALLDWLHKSRCFISVFTEAGFMFKSTAGDSAGITRTILDVYGYSGHLAKMEPESYSSDKDSIPAVIGPCFSMVNESTPDIFMEAMSGEEGTKTGELTRMTIMKIEEESTELNRDMKYEVSEILLAVFKSLTAFCNVTQTEDDAKPITLIESDEQIIYIDECKAESKRCIGSDPIRGRMLSRQGFKTLKIAALLSVIDSAEEMYNNGCLNASRFTWHVDEGKPMIVNDRAWEWAKKLSRYELGGLGLLFKDYNADYKDMALKDAYDIIIKLFELRGESYAGKMRLSKIQIKENIVPRWNLRKALSGRPSIKRLKSAGPMPEVDVVLGYMVKTGYLMSQKSKRGEEYRVAKKFLEDYK